MKDTYQKSISEIMEEFNASKRGLTNKKARQLLRQTGHNTLSDTNKTTKLQLFFKQFQNIMIILLLIVGVLSLIYSIVNKSDFLEPIVILGTSILNCFMGFLQESKAEDAIGKLKKYTANYVTVKRNNRYRQIEAQNLVVGDYIVLESGDKIPADGRIIKSYFAKVDESILTGESMTVDKTADVIEKKVAISERKNMIYSGTVLIAGKIEAIIVATGMHTELGKIAKAMNETTEPLTPLQIKIQKISRFITVIAAFLVALVLGYGLINHYDILSIVMLCVSMIVASVPESLPIAITATLTIGVNQMAKEKSIVRNLAAIETLGSTNIICSDKTGTLTKNKMEVVKIFASNKEIEDLKAEDKLIQIMSLCNTATLDNHNVYCGDAVDVALKNCLVDSGIKELKDKKIAELPFDSNRKMMSTIFNHEQKTMLYTKGSLESILKKCNHILINNQVVELTNDLKKLYRKQEKNMSKIALKVLALAYKEIKGKHTDEQSYLKEEDNLILVGLVGLKDPVRSNIAESIQTCLKAHIRPIMLTGDNLPTAYSIAKEVGICQTEKECLNASELDGLNNRELIKIIKKHSVFARVSPEHKLQIVSALQKQGLVVAMTGDGVNDAPALKKANVGVGMGKSGTDVTKDVADIILLDDSFNTITTAIKEGRRIYDNVITNILYNLSSNFTEIIIILFGMFTGKGIISAIHVLYIDLVADTLPSITLAFEGASKDVMERKPNGLNKPIFTPFFLAFLITSVVIETFVGLFVYFHFLPFGHALAQTLTLLCIIINEFIFAYNCRSLKEPIYQRGLFSNKYLNAGILILLIIQLIVFFTPIGFIFGLTSITMLEFVYVVIVNIMAFVIIELLKPLLTKIFKDE